jgi:hypothetical protein
MDSGGICGKIVVFIFINLGFYGFAAFFPIFIALGPTSTERGLNPMIIVFPYICLVFMFLPFVIMFFRIKVLSLQQFKDLTNQWRQINI